MSRYSHLILAALALLALWAYGCENRQAGRLEAEKVALEHRNARLEDEAGRKDTVYVKDTIRLKIYTQSYKTLRDTLRITDTVQVRATLALADSTINACSVALQTCETRVALRDQRIAVLDSLLTVERKRQPGFIKRRFGCTAGVAATTKGAGLGASCGVRFP